ncbi:MAG: 2-C-methyl-D-erythritol 2,4-cyclodiphosphate synthase [Firmicutes bacterium]|jgi:2-C-methyl-D-erythritol 4-phosphate cytidylyltransferase/2-C-methyl-D-erythritol 2,4-cyclodiphosphate synthase|nr:2-C-methyl-D-erythritol 2,4-cyclodiphosphate synthase [Bacillota bacterium]
MALGEKQAVAIVAAAGSGRRMGPGRPKLLREIEGKPVLVRTLEALDLPELEAVFLLLHPEEKGQVLPVLENQLRTYGYKHQLVIIDGGERRQDSVLAGLRAAGRWGGWRVPEADRLVLIHDGARPLVGEEVIRRVLAAAARTGAAAAGVPVKDTIKKVGEDGMVLETPDRRRLWAVQTPQVFSWPVIVHAHSKAEAEGLSATDDCALVEAAGHPVQMVMGSYANLKITTPEDLLTASALLKEAAASRYRVGQGFDLHRLEPGRRLVLGGVEIPAPFGLAGHSDADVAVHAVIDALLGAAALGDIGELFPDDDPAYKDIDSCLLLKEVMAKLAAAGFRPINLDLTIIAQQPKIAPYREKMKKNLADLLDVAETAVSIKATTTEGLGATGRGEGIAAQAVVLLKGKP